MRKAQRSYFLLAEGTAFLFLIGRREAKAQRSFFLLVKRIPYALRHDVPDECFFETPCIKFLLVNILFSNQMSRGKRKRGSTSTNQQNNSNNSSSIQNNPILVQNFTSPEVLQNTPVQTTSNNSHFVGNHSAPSVRRNSNHIGKNSVFPGKSPLSLGRRTVYVGKNLGKSSLFSGRRRISQHGSILNHYLRENCATQPVIQRIR